MSLYDESKWDMGTYASDMVAVLCVSPLVKSTKVQKKERGKLYVFLWKGTHILAHLL